MHNKGSVIMRNKLWGLLAMGVCVTGVSLHAQSVEDSSYWKSSSPRGLQRKDQALRTLLGSGQLL